MRDAAVNTLLSLRCALVREIWLHGRGMCRYIWQRAWVLCDIRHHRNRYPKRYISLLRAYQIRYNCFPASHIWQTHMQTLHKVKVTETVTRTTVIEVRAGSAEEANAKGIHQARDVQGADWDYTWEPITSTSQIALSN